MIDQEKRNTLKNVSIVTAATAIAPGMTASAMSTMQSVESPTGTGDAGLTFDIEPANDISPTWLRINNPTEQTVRVSQISPGIVTSGDDVFDLNAPLADGPFTIGPDESYSFMIYPLDHMDAAITVAEDAVVADMVFMPTHFNQAHGEGSVMAARRLIS